VWAGAGDDRIFGAGGGADHIVCGPGYDIVFGYTADSIVRGCEEVWGPAFPTP
jgi:hypothetical protein